MRILILFFSMGGRTKAVAKSIAERLNASEITIEEFKYTKKLKDFLSEQHEIFKGNLLNFNYNEDVIDLKPYDFIFFGTPTYGGLPATIFDGYLEHVQNIQGKNFIIFSTCRFSSGKIFEKMQAEIEKKGGIVVNKRAFKGLFKINVAEINKFAEELNQELT
ncbi:MAG: flavodoxin family protein [Promethearchaeota archaeon]